MSCDEAAQSILTIRDWRHPYDLGNGRTVSLDKPWYKEWHTWRLAVDIDNIAKIVGGLEGKTLIDVACNDGYYGFQYEKRGAIVTGVDAREDAVARARLIKDYFGHRNITHSQEDLQHIDYRARFPKPFDITLFYGILYHLSDPLGVLLAIGRITSKVIAVQTFVHGEESEPILKLHDEPTELPGMGTTTVVTTPSQAAVAKMLKYAGFDLVFRACPYPYEAARINKGCVPSWHWAFFYGVKTGSHAERARVVKALEASKTYHPSRHASQVIEIDPKTRPLNPFLLSSRIFDRAKLTAKRGVKRALGH